MKTSLDANLHLNFLHGGKNNNGNLLLKLHLLIGLETPLHVDCQPRHLHKSESQVKDRVDLGYLFCWRLLLFLHWLSSSLDVKEDNIVGSPAVPLKIILSHPQPTVHADV